MNKETDIEYFNSMIQADASLKKYYDTIVREYEHKITLLNLTLSDLQQQLDDTHLNNSKFVHELRNQTTIVKSTAQLFEAANSEVTNMKYWNQVISSINIYEAYINDYSVCNNSTNISKKPGNLEDFILSELQNYYPISEQSNITMSYSISDEAKPFYIDYTFDPLKLKHVINNILRNAFEACDESNSIKVNCSIENNNLAISISNNGSMIPEDEIATIFEPYITYKSNGSGLGLAIVSNIVQSHGGSISVKSSDDLTVFTIYLPVITKE